MKRSHNPWKLLAVAALVLAMVAPALSASKVYVDILNDKLVSAANTVTTSKPMVDLVQTWNAGGVTFETIKVAITSTASAAGSSLIDLKVGGASKFKVDKSGVATLGTALAADQGGTGLATYAVGDIPYASAATTISKLAAVATGQVLVSQGVTTAPAYSAAPAVDTIALATPKLTAGSGTGVTVNDAGTVRTQTYKVTVAKENFISAGVTHDLTIATLPAGTIVHSVVARVTEAFACTAVCTTATLSATLGITAGGTEFLASADIDAAIATFGDADGELGSAFTIAGQFNSGYVSSLTGTTTVVMRATSGTGNWGDAATTNLSAGSITFYLVATVLP